MGSGVLKLAEQSLELRKLGEQVAGGQVGEGEVGEGADGQTDD